MASIETSPDPSESSGTVYTGETDSTGPDSEELLTLLGDSYTQQVLTAIGDGVRTGREIIEHADVSKATAYRRLDELQEAGIVDSTLRIDPNGHHCEQYFVVADALSVTFNSDGFDATVAQSGGCMKTNRVANR